jgi:hypothetical protein
LERGVQPGQHPIPSASYDETVRHGRRFPNPASAMCDKLTTNMSHRQWRDWLSPNIDYIKVSPNLPIAPD